MTTDEVKKKGSNQKHNAELQKKKLGINFILGHILWFNFYLIFFFKVDSQLSSVMNRKCYLIAFTIILLAVGYPILLSIFFARSSKDDSLSSYPDSEQACKFFFFF